VDELGLKNEDIAYYATYILGCNNPGLEQRIQYIEDFRSGFVDVEGVLCTTKENRIVQKDYRDFFNITPPVIAKVLKDLKKKLPEKRKRADPGIQMNEEMEGEVKNYSDTGIQEEEPIEENKEGKDITQGDDSGEENTTENTLDSINTQAEIENEEDQQPGKEGENESMLADKSKKTYKSIPRTNERKIRFKTTPGDGSLTSPSDKKIHISSPDEESEEAVNENEEAYSSDTVYEKNKSAIDSVVQKKIIEKGAEKSKSSAHTMRVSSEKVTEEEKTPLSKRISRLLFDLSKCFPEAVPDIINRTIIPVFVENKSEAGRDIFNALNQNIFIPVLYNGAEVDVDSTIESIESFLGNKGILSESHKVIKSIVNGLRTTRSKEIKAEVDRKMNKTVETFETTVKKPENIVQVLRYLLDIHEPDRILPALDEKYIVPLSGNTEQQGLIKKLHTLKSILHTSKSINWQKVGDYYGGDAIVLIKQIKQRIPVTRDQSLSGEKMVPRGKKMESGENNQTQMDETNPDTTGTDKLETEIEEKKESPSEEKVVVPKIIENTLINVPAFTDPHTVILKIASKDAGLYKMLGKDRDVARQYIIDTLYNAGKIFTYDKKRYIGFGKLAHYLYNKANKDFNRQALAQALFTFISRLPGNEHKASFIGVEEKDLTGFLHMLEAWVQPANLPAGKKTISGPSKILSKNADNKNKVTQPTHHDRTKQTVTQKDQVTTKKTIQTTPRIKDRRTYNRRKQQTHYPAEKERRKKDRRLSDIKATKKKHSEQKKSTPRKLSARGEAMLKKAEKLITEKLIHLIKLYNSRESLKMLYNSYLSASSDRKYRLNLVDEKKHSAIYNAIKDDDAVLERLRFDVNKVMKHYHKKIKKAKK